jgi:hypothetical protein
MTDPRSLLHLLGHDGHDGHDPGCDAAFAVMDEYAEAGAAGRDAAAEHPGVARHLRDCAACREDVEGLRRLLEDPPPPAR